MLVHGEAEQVDQRAQLGRGIAQDDAAAGVDVRALRRRAAAARALRICPPWPLRTGLYERISTLARIAGTALVDIETSFGMSTTHRAGPAGAGDVERLLHRHRQVAHVLDEEVVLDDRPRDADGVALLERVQADRRRRHLAGDDHHRDRVHVGGRDAGDGIGHARAGGDERDADLAGRARIAVGGVHRGLLVAHQDVLDVSCL